MKLTATPTTVFTAKSKCRVRLTRENYNETQSTVLINDEEVDNVLLGEGAKNKTFPVHRVLEYDLKKGDVLKATGEGVEAEIIVL